MEITSKKELRFYIKADTMMNRGYFTPPLCKKVARIVNPDIVMDFLKYMRCYSYYRQHEKGSLNKIRSAYYKLRFLKLSKKCGFSIYEFFNFVYL